MIAQSDPKRNHRLTMMWSDFYKESAIRLRDSPNQEVTSKEITAELLLKCGKLKESSTIYHFKLTRRHAKKLGTLLWLPKCPGDVYKRVSDIGQTRVANRIEDPIVIDADKLIELMVNGLRDGITRKQYPQIVFCLNYLIALRPNDLNKGHVRINSPRDGVLPIDHVIAHGKFNDFDVCGTILNNNPSKFIEGKRSIVAYSTVFICPIADYEVVEQGIAFVQNEENISVPCTGYVDHYLKDLPCGPTTSQQWGSARAGIMKCMVDRLKLNTAVRNWASHKFGFTKQLGRGFVASCVEQGRFELDTGLTPMKSVELLLGHEKLSSSNVCYLKMDVRPTQLEGVILRRVSQENQLNGATYGVCLTK
jgi:hypothetical protein